MWIQHNFLLLYSSVVLDELAPTRINMVKKTMFINSQKIKELVFGPVIQKTNQRTAQKTYLP